MTKCVILFGAGASNGLSNTGARLPPLGGKSLFDELEEEYPLTWGSLPADHALLFQYDFEDGMDRLIEEASKSGKWNIADFQKDLAYFFSNFSLPVNSNTEYDQLIYELYFELITRRVVLSTTNYDCLIESAIWNTSGNVAYNEDGEGILLLKIHGSCNFIPEHTVHTQTYCNTGGIFDSSIKVVPPRNVKKCVAEEKIDPAMRLYRKSKDAISCPTILDSIQNEFIRVIKEVELIIIIGLKPNKNDTHIWERIAETNAKILIFNPDQRCKEWLEINNKPAEWWIPKKFKECCIDIIINIQQIE